ncbi:hypothetical protein NLM24_19675 [Nocardia zapadnayensis]|uniref:hypothetical protein n=1 Tax=Nocardia rhamnosiphila TaxID=426716 RepID=UPI0022471502|nr:hypothetical protein [Nocardia zapadnayensis]MCX0272887.1 hypothetical protein [Nocardia zapadnayensis]
MRYVAVLVGGMLLLVLGAQGAIRILADHDDAGLLSGLPGGFPVQLLVYAAAAGLGALLAGWGSRKSKQGNANK